MGIIFGKSYNDSTEEENIEITNNIREINESINNHIKQIENKYEAMFKESKKIIDELKYEINKWEEKANQSQIENIELTKQIDSLIATNKSLEEQINQVTQKIDNKSRNIFTNDEFKENTTKKIDTFINKLLKDENINIKYMPDFVERQVYKNIITLLMSTMHHILDSIDINIMGHKITFNCIQENSSNNSNNNDLFT